MLNDMKRNKLQPSPAYNEARAVLMKRFGKQKEGQLPYVGPHQSAGWV